MLNKPSSGYRGWLRESGSARKNNLPGWATLHLAMLDYASIVVLFHYSSNILAS